MSCMMVSQQKKRRELVKIGEKRGQFESNHFMIKSDHLTDTRFPGGRVSGKILQPSGKLLVVLFKFLGLSSLIESQSPKSHTNNFSLKWQCLNNVTISLFLTLLKSF